MFAEGGSSNVLLIGVLILAVVGMFFMSRRNRKQQGTVTDFRANLGPGDEVMTASGQLGVVVAKDGDAVTIESAGARSTWVIAAIQQVPPQFTAAADAAFGRTPAEAESEPELDGEPEYGALADDVTRSDDVTPVDPTQDDRGTDEGPENPDARR